MRRRLLTIIVALVAGLVAALGFPLAVATAERTSQELFISRVGDTARFADMAESALSTGRAGRLEADLTRYDALYDTPALVVNADQTVIASSRKDLNASSADVHNAVLRGLAGRLPQLPHVLWPWDSRPYVIVQPVVQGSRVLGAAVTISPTVSARGEVTERLAALGLGGLVAVLVMALVVAVPIVRWVLRPVHDLDEAAHAVGSGKLSTHVSDRAGPPELRRLATSFNAMADSVDAAARRQREFVAQASHQLRNPLTALRLRMENAESYAADPDSREELHFALEEADRLGETVDAMLDLARAESTPDVPQSVDVSAAIRRRAQAWEVAYAHSHTALELDAPPGMTAVCLPDLLEHGLDALLDNALKYGRGGTVDVTARSPRAGWVEIEVRDTGPGLLPDEFGHAGDRFWRSPRHQNMPGTGLGLAITRTLAEGSGGSMVLAARHPHGLAVRVLLPASA